MKYGVIVFKETANVGDDIQSYAAANLLPEVNYYIEREHMDVFRPEENEPVNAIINGWFMDNKLGWPISPCINPLYVSMHFFEKDMLLLEDDFLKDLGGEDLKAHAPIGARDKSTQLLLEKNGIHSYLSGCITLTLPRKFKKPVEEQYVCLTDISDEAIAYVQRKYPHLNIKLIEHVPDKLPARVDKNADWATRFKQVEELLTIYQNAQAVITTRLHCAMPCLALGTPVLLLNDEDLFDHGRLDGLSDLVHAATTKDFIADNVLFDLENPPSNPEHYLQFRNTLIETVNQFIKDSSFCTQALKDRFDTYDSQWEIRALWKNEILRKLPLKHAQQWEQTHSAFEEMEKGRSWLEQQNTSLTQELETAKQWNADLQEGKQWLEQQNTGLTQELETVKQWSAELQEAKQWLEQQNAELIQQIVELKGWIEELERGKTYLLEQWQSEQKAHKKTSSVVNQMNDALMNQENTISRQRYMLDLLLKDKWIQKIIQLRKIPVYE